MMEINWLQIFGWGGKVFQEQDGIAAKAHGFHLGGGGRIDANIKEGGNQPVAIFGIEKASVDKICEKLTCLNGRMTVAKAVTIFVIIEVSSAPIGGLHILKDIETSRLEQLLKQHGKAQQLMVGVMGAVIDDQRNRMLHICNSSLQILGLGLINPQHTGVSIRPVSMVKVEAIMKGVGEQGLPEGYSFPCPKANL
jgi:hypothetical protein